MITYVAQPNGYGCAIACLAMIAGKTYDELEEWLVEQGLSRERMERGLHEGIWMEALDRLDFVYARRYLADSFLNGPRATPWPCAPFAPIHICVVEVPNGYSHAIVMLADGAVFDPYKRERASLAHPDYAKVNQICGVWPKPPTPWIY